MFIVVGGTLPANRTVTVPTNSKLYFVHNNTSGAYTLSFQATAGVLVPQGKKVPLYSDGTDILYAFDHLGSLTLGTALAATSGGTGQSSYAVGDLLYAGTTTTLAKLASVATGNVLRAGGVGTAPAWGKVDLTTDVTGVLPAANGGTGLSVFPAPGTLGNVLYSDGTDWTAADLSTLVPDASDTAKGVVELATTAEVQTGTDTTRAITPAGLRGGALVRMTAQPTTSGTSITFTGIPSWVKRITVMLSAVSTSGSNNLLVRIGDSGGIETTSYASCAQLGAGAATDTTGFIITRTILSTSTTSGMVVLTNIDGNTWTMSANIFETAGSTTSSAGVKTLSDVLTQLSFTNVNSADTFDAGSVNVMYE
jgi:hypothetical protein